MAIWNGGVWVISVVLVNGKSDTEKSTWSKWEIMMHWLDVWMKNRIFSSIFRRWKIRLAFVGDLPLAASIDLSFLHCCLGSIVQRFYIKSWKSAFIYGPMHDACFIEKLFYVHRRWSPMMPTEKTFHIYNPNDFSVKSAISFPRASHIFCTHILSRMAHSHKNSQSTLSAYHIAKQCEMTALFPSHAPSPPLCFFRRCLLSVQCPEIDKNQREREKLVAKHRWKQRCCCMLQ